MKHKLLILFSILFLSNLVAQTNVIPRVFDEKMLVETKWKYQHTLQVESNTIIHQAKKEYNFFLYFKYDNTYDQFLNGKTTTGRWKIKGEVLMYSFRGIDEFRLIDLTNKAMVLEFKQPNTKSTFQYHFINVLAEETPFLKPQTELPLIVVEAERKEKEAQRKEKKGFWSWTHFAKKEKNDEKELVYINIELTGGGYYGGINPTQRDFIVIKTDGRLIKEYKSSYDGYSVTKKNISRQELEELADYMMKEQFFEMQKEYDCNSASCNYRKGKKPTPVPLRLALTYGTRRKVVTISIWGKDELQTQYVSYPPSLDKIIDAIQRMASRV